MVRGYESLVVLLVIQENINETAENINETAYWGKKIYGLMSIKYQMKMNNCV